MPQQNEAKLLVHLTEVPASWPLATVMDAFLDLARFFGAGYLEDRAREALSLRLVELWAAQPAEAEAWLERRRLEAELQKSQEEECRDLRNRLAAAEAQVSSKDAELQAAQNESAKCQERCAAAESAKAVMQKELRQLQAEHSKCQEGCEELANRMDAEASEHAKTKELLAQAESDAAEKQLEVQRLQEESRSYYEHCPKTDSHPASSEEGESKAELQLQKAVLQGRCEQLQHQLAKAEAKLDLLQDLREEIGMYKERLRGLERQLVETKTKSPRVAGGGISGHPALNARIPARNDAAFGDQESDLAQQLGYNLVDEDGASVLSGSSGCSVKQNCFMLDAIFKSRMDVFREGSDLQKGSQVLAGDGKTVLEVVEFSKEGQATEVVDLQAGAATLRVTPDHPVQVPNEGGNAGRPLYVPAGKLKAGDFVMNDSGEPVALTTAETLPVECKVLKIVFKPDLPVAVFSSPSCILSKGHKKKTQPGRRGGGGTGKEAADPMDARA
ncbi:unnamed protein product [Symbiodinium sp. CCMP2592]|nr:unnamed protein product [Symbiodinium sp. CCMP2592]